MTRRAHESRLTLGQPLQPGSLRAQFALVIGLLSFLPNVIVAFILARITGLTNYPLLLGWMMLVAAASALVGYVLSRALLRSLTHLARELGAGRLSPPRPDDPSEVRSLRLAFGGLLSRLGQERDRRNAFMATLVHDLKTPLIATNHLVTALRDYPITDAERQEIYTQLIDENGRLLYLVQQMVDAHKFEREGVEIDRASVNLHVLAERQLQRIRTVALERQLRLELHGSGSARADARQLERALTNLLDNAVRYAITCVRVEVAPHAVRVMNDGPPLAQSLETLAQPFNAQPVEIAGRQYTSGTIGLGLFIVRRVAEAHGGALTYTRHDPWTVFTITLREDA